MVGWQEPKPFDSKNALLPVWRPTKHNPISGLFGVFEDSTQLLSHAKRQKRSITVVALSPFVSHCFFFAK